MKVQVSTRIRVFLNKFVTRVPSWFFIINRFKNESVLSISYWYVPKIPSYDIILDQLI